MDLRRAQLELRQAELREALLVFQRINSGECESLGAESAQVSQFDWKDWKGKLDVDSPWALGHSFGGATAIEEIRKSDSPFARALILDPVRRTLFDTLTRKGVADCWVTCSGLSLSRKLARLSQLRSRYML